MKVLVIGSGAREHCIAWKLAQSPSVNKVYCAPGNGGTSDLGENINIKADDIESLSGFALKEKVELTVVGPEVPLVEGIVDQFKRKGLRVFGPAKELAKLESSKVFAKELMKEFNIPTADFKVFDSAQEAKKHIQNRRLPMVVKADGLAAGKGVIVCKTKEEAIRAVDIMMIDQVFGASGKKVIIEDCLEGRELSLLVFTDGKKIVPLAGSQDYKRAFDGGQGPNTGGMGAYSPVPFLSHEQFNKAVEVVFRPLLHGLGQKNKIYTGVLYAGLMLYEDKINVLEFNVRFGDPETQAILPRLKGDLPDIMNKVIDSELDKAELEWEKKSSVCVVLASGGYPGEYEKGKVISGLLEAEKEEDVFVFHAGTKMVEDSSGNSIFLTEGGRVLSVVALGQDISQAKEKAYRAAGKIYFEGMQYRKDIGGVVLSKAG